MKTDDLIVMLAKQDVAVDRKRLMWKVVLALVVGSIASFALLTIVFRVNPDLKMMLMNLWFWVRFAFIASVVVVAGTLFSRLGKPAQAQRVSVWPVVVPFAVLGAIACVLLMMAPADSRRDMLLGVSWNVCARNISLLSIPFFFVAVWIARQFAPVRLRFTGAMLGLFSGAAGALVYSLHCPEIAPSFLVIWYTMGMLIPAAVGALLGRKLLNW
ncbi:MAG: NrsF family protein [Casimicrobium sp.]